MPRSRRGLTKSREKSAAWHFACPNRGRPIAPRRRSRRARPWGRLSSGGRVVRHGRMKRQPYPGRLRSRPVRLMRLSGCGRGGRMPRRGWVCPRWKPRPSPRPPFICRHSRHRRGRHGLCRRPARGQSVRPHRKPGPFALSRESIGRAERRSRHSHDRSRCRGDAVQENAPNTPKPEVIVATAITTHLYQPRSR